MNLDTSSYIFSGHDPYTRRAPVGALRAIALAGAAFTSSWTGYAIGGIQLVDALLLITALLSIAPILTGQPLPIRAWWLSIGTAAVAVTALTHVYFPPDREYISSRFTLLSNERLSILNGTTGGLIDGLQWLVALTLLPLVLVYAVRDRPALLRTVVLAWFAGAVVNGTVAILDFANFTNIGPTILGYESITGRQNGLTSQANSLGFICSMAVPLGLFFARRWPLVMSSSCVILVFGCFVSGSRGSQAALLIAVLTYVAWRRPGWRFTGWLISIGTALAIVAQLAPSFARLDTSGLLRFGSTDSSSLSSDNGRLLLFSQAMQDFAYRPIDGIGLAVLRHAHSVPLQLLAAGGLLLFTGIILYFVGVITSGLRIRKMHEGLPTALLIAIGVWCIQMPFQNQLVDRFLYFPIAAIFALCVFPHVTRADPAPARVGPDRRGPVRH